jgi:hypothetical protein
MEFFTPEWNRTESRQGLRVPCPPSLTDIHTGAKSALEIRFGYRRAEGGATSNDRKYMNIARKFQQRFAREDRVIEVRRDREKTAGRIEISETPFHKGGFARQRHSAAGETFFGFLAAVLMISRQSRAFEGGGHCGRKR